MVNCYVQTQRLFQNGECVQTRTTHFLAEDTDPSLAETPNTKITWDSLFDFVGHHPWVNFSPEEQKKGKYIFGFACFGITSVSQWKSPNTTTLSYSVSRAVETKASLEDIFKYRNSELAIRYLAERGMNILVNMQEGK